MKQKYRVNRLRVGKRRLFFTRIFDIDLLIYPQPINWPELWMRPHFFWSDLWFHIQHFCHGIGVIALMLLRSAIYACSPTLYYRLTFKKGAPEARPFNRQDGRVLSEPRE